MKPVKKPDEEKIEAQTLHIGQEFMNSNELHSMENYDGLPEFDIADHNNYDVREGPVFLRFHTPIGKDEVLPIPPEHTLRHNEVHWEIENWSIQRALPQMMTYHKDLMTMADQIYKGHVVIPDYLNEVQRPSLWAYYETLPRWARNHPIVRNVVMACEYHKPWLSIRQKEEGLNFACSFLRPIDSTMKKVLATGAASNKVEINMKTGTEMMNELQFYTFAPEDLGTDSD